MSLSPFRNGKFREGAPRPKQLGNAEVAAGLGVNRNLVRFLELVSSPQYQLTSSLFWSAKEGGGSGGRKPAANLAAMQLRSWERSCSFRLEAANAAATEPPGESLASMSSQTTSLLCVSYGARSERSCGKSLTELPAKSEARNSVRTALSGPPPLEATTSDVCMRATRTRHPR